MRAVPALAFGRRAFRTVQQNLWLTAAYDVGGILLAPLGWLYLIDPVVTGLIVAGLLLSWRWPSRGASASRWALGLLAVYVLAAGMLAGTAALRWERWLDEHGVEATRTAVVPTFPGPWRWVGVAEAGDTLYRAGSPLAAGPGFHRRRSATSRWPGWTASSGRRRCGASGRSRDSRGERSSPRRGVATAP